MSLLFVQSFASTPDHVACMMCVATGVRPAPLPCKVTLTTCVSYTSMHASPALPLRPSPLLMLLCRCGHCGCRCCAVPGLGCRLWLTSPTSHPCRKPGAWGAVLDRCDPRPLYCTCTLVSAFQSMLLGQACSCCCCWSGWGFSLYDARVVGWCCEAHSAATYGIKANAQQAVFQHSQTAHG